MEEIKCRNCGGAELAREGRFVVCQFCNSKFESEEKAKSLKCQNCGESDQVRSFAAIATAGGSNQNVALAPAKPARPKVIPQVVPWSIWAFAIVVIITFVTDPIQPIVSGIVVSLVCAATGYFFFQKRRKQLETFERDKAQFDAAIAEWESGRRRLMSSSFCARCFRLFDDEASLDVETFKMQAFGSAYSTAQAPLNSDVQISVPSGQAKKKFTGLDILLGILTYGLWFIWVYVRNNRNS